MFSCKIHVHVLIEEPRDLYIPLSWTSYPVQGSLKSGTSPKHNFNPVYQKHPLQDERLCPYMSKNKITET